MEVIFVGGVVTLIGGFVPGLCFAVRHPRSLLLLSGSAGVCTAGWHQERLGIPKSSLLLVVPVSAGFFTGHSLRCGGAAAVALSRQLARKLR
mmetsp:Transcript_4682/g.9644  ORF Transcript_4682/g.9644 Transcript_4682/m.9644 type:complete len:92 (-) Transcript_4682:231-506(-)